jgi:hypothetical protein
LRKVIDNFRIFVFRHDEEIHGSIFVSANKNISDVVGLFIDEEYKNKGIESILINEMLTHLYNEFGAIREILYFIEQHATDELNIALTTKVKFIDQSSCVIDLDALVDSKILQKYKKEIEYDKKMIDELIAKSIEYVNEAKLAHDKLESFYIPAMDFNAVNEKRKEILKRILQYA